MSPVRLLVPSSRLTDSAKPVMQIEQLDLIAYGPFSETRLDFSQLGTGLHLVYGPNEAGKSSALSALLDFLFGFPNRSGATFKHDTKNVRVGATIKHQSQTLSLVRRKGRKDTLQTPSGQSVDSQHLENILGGIARSRYEQEFGINYSQLVTGGRELAAGKGELASALFAAATGTDRWSQLKQELDEEARQLFLPRGSNPRINALSGKIADLKTRLEEIQLLPSRWRQLTEQIQLLEDQYRSRQREWEWCGKRLQQVQYQDRLKPLVQNYHTARNQFVNSKLLRLPIESELENWRIQLERLGEKLARWQERQAQSEDLAARGTSLPNQTMLAHSKELDALLENLARFQEQHEQVLQEVEQRQDSQRARQQVAGQLDEAFGSVPSPKDPETCDPGGTVGEPSNPVHQQTLWDDHTPWYLSPLSIQDRNGLASVVADLKAAQQKWESISQELESLGKRWDVELTNSENDELPGEELQEQVLQFLNHAQELPAWLQMEREWESQVLDCERRIEQLQTRYPQLRAQDWREVDTTQWPEESEVRQLAARRLRAGQDVARVQREQESLQSKLAGLSDRRLRVSDISDQKYETWVEWLRETWRQIRTLWDEPDSEGIVAWGQGFVVEANRTDVGFQWSAEIAEKEDVANLYEYLLESVLEIQRVRIEGSDQLAEARQLDREVAECRREMEKQDRQLVQFQQVHRDCQQEWELLTGRYPIRMEADEVDHMLPAVTSFRELMVQHREWTQKLENGRDPWRPMIATLTDLVSRISSNRDDGTEHSRESTPAAQWKILTAVAEHWRLAGQKRQASQVARESLRQRIEEATAQREVRQCEMANCEQRLREQLVSAGLPPMLNWEQVEQWLSLMDQWQQLDAVVVGQEQALSKSIGKLERFAKAFHELYRKVADPECQDVPVELAMPVSLPDWTDWSNRVGVLLDEWKSQRTEQQDAGQRYQERKSQLNQLRLATEKLKEELRVGWTAMSEKLSGCLASDDALISTEDGKTLKPTAWEDGAWERWAMTTRNHLAQRLEQIEQAREEAVRLDNRLREIAELGGLEQLNAKGKVAVRLADESTYPELPDDPVALKQRYSELHTEVEELGQSLAIQRQDLERRRQDTEAVRLQQEIETHLAELEGLCDQYLDCSWAAILLDESMVRYSRANQHPILGLANDYFRQLTLGSFQDLEATSDPQGRKVLVGIRSDQSVVPVTGMSEGTESQLYLALRLASLDHYLQHHPALPFVVDDVLKDYDDQRALAALRAFCSVGQRTQLIVFTHHEHLLSLAEQHLDPDQFQSHWLQSGHAQTRPV